MKSLFAIFGFACLLAAQEPSQADFEMYYTGRLLGHGRVPNRQTSAHLDMKQCAQWRTDHVGADGKPNTAENPSLAAGEVRKLWKEMNKTGKKGALLVSLGDNFAPEYDARVINFSGLEVPKDMLVWHKSKWLDVSKASRDELESYWLETEKPGLGEVKFDNVACYLAWMGYHAIVPGKHDAHFGAERLRQYASTLDEVKVRMLAANLHVVTTEPRAPAALEERFRSRLLLNGKKSRRYTVIDEEVKIAIPKTVYPWIQKVKISGIRKFFGFGAKLPFNAEQLKEKPTIDRVVDLVGRYLLCEAKPDETDLIFEEADRCRDLGKPAELAESFEAPIAGVQRGKNYAICLEWNPADGMVPKPKKPRTEPFCQTFTVAEPLLRKGGWAQGETKAPFYVHPDGTAVFGVVSTTFTQTVSRLNLAWHNTNPREFETQLAVGDEAEALLQALDACSVEALCRAAKHRVLLAQMPEEAAGALARKLASSAKFDVVVAEANLRGSTPTQDITRPVKEAGARAIIYSPGAIFSKDEKLPILSPYLQKIEIHQLGENQLFRHIAKRCEPNQCPAYDKPELEGLKRREEKRVVMKRIQSDVQATTQRPNPNAAKSSGGEEVSKTLGDRARSVLQQRFGAPEAEVSQWSNEECLQKMIVESMRRDAKADVALLQKRDFFVSNAAVLKEPLQRIDIQEVMDRILWKGDFLVRVAVKGSVLKEVMEQSKSLAKADSDLLRIETERERDLISIGVYFDAVSSQYMVNGATLDTERLYSVAMPDHMAFGDSGYPALKKPDGIEAVSVRRWSQLRPVSHVGCINVVEGEDLALCLYPRIDTQSYLDNVDRVPPNVSGNPTRWERLRAQTLAGLLPRNWLQSADGLTGRVQQRGTWAITLDKIQGGFNGYQRNRPDEKRVKELFAGLNSPSRVLSPESKNLDASIRLRVARTIRMGDLYGLAESSLVYNRVRDKENFYIPDIKDNVWAGEFGWNPRLGYSGPRSSEWLGLIALRYEDNLMSPITSAALGDGTVRERIARTPSLVGKAGVRWAGKTSWFEAGFLAGQRSNVPIGFGFTTAMRIAEARTAARDDSGRLRVLRDGFYCSAANIGTVELLPLPNPLPSELEAIRPYLDNADRANFGDCVKRKATLFKFSHSQSTPYGMLGDYLDRPRIGNFLNLRFQIPLFASTNHFYVMENTGELLYNTGQDLPLETRLMNTWSHSLQLGLWKNLSVVPKIEIFYFRNKVQGNSITGLSSKINLQYRFDWRPGLAWRNTRAYPYPAAPK